MMNTASVVDAGTRLLGRELTLRRVLTGVVAEQMAVALVDIHRLDGSGLRVTPLEPPTGASGLAARVRRDWHRLDLRELVLTHSDFWCGNALWDGDRLVGVVDWSGARLPPRGIDVAWCRQDLVLLGSSAAADAFLDEYQRQSGTALTDVRAWDLLAAAYADPIVETWAPNYAGIDRAEITPAVLRSRFDQWATTILS